MNGPATIDMVHQSVTLTNGGIVTSNTGNLIQSYNNGEIVSLTQVANTNMVPITINRSFTLPTGYYIPTRPKSGTWPAYVQMPITK